MAAISRACYVAAILAYAIVLSIHLSLVGLVLDLFLVPPLILGFFDVFRQ